MDKQLAVIESQIRSIGENIRYLAVLVSLLILATCLTGCAATKGDCTIEPIPCVEEGTPVVVTKLGGENE
jgi:hypothetical protein